MFFDSHAHMDDERFIEDRNQLIQTLFKENRVKYILNPGVDEKRSNEAVELAYKYDGIYAGVGYHPHEVDTLNDEILARIEQLAQSSKVVAIGEIGLDYYYDHSPRELQKHWFIKQIELAKKLNKPIIVHDRDAHGDTMQILKDTHAKSVGGVVHCFAGSVEMAKECVENNFYIGVGGVVTFKNAKKLVEVVKETPLEWILLETDAPYLTPEPHRGKRNDSSYLQYIAQKIADIKNITVEEVANQTHDNAKRLFCI